MGSRMAQRLIAAGHTVVVHNRSQQAADRLVEAGASRASSPREAAAGADFVMAMVTDDEASRSVWLDPNEGASGGLVAGAIAIESSTLTPAWIAELSTAVAARGARFLDAPVVGSRPQADAGQLVHLVGGQASVFDNAKPVFAAIGSAAHHVGPTGSGAILKLAVNAFFGIQIAALGELLGFLAKDSLDLSRTLEVLASLPVMSPAAKGIATLIATGNHAPLFPVSLIEKDFRYALAAAARRDAELPVTAATQEQYARALAQGYGDENASSVSKLFLKPPARP